MKNPESEVAKKKKMQADHGKSRDINKDGRQQVALGKIHNGKLIIQIGGRGDGSNGHNPGVVGASQEQITNGKNTNLA